MREIVFRGKRVDNDEWVYGYYSGPVGIDTIHEICDINDPTGIMLDVDPATVSQYTGLTDKNGKEIFEGDVVTGLFLYALPINGCVGFREGAFGLHWMRGGWEEFTPFTSMCHVEFEIIGNIHDNPELMGGTKNEPLRQA